MSPLAPILPLSPLELLLPLSPLKPLSSLEPFYDQWIVIVSNGSSSAPMVPLLPLVTIGDIPFRWTFQSAHRHRMTPMEPFKWRHWSPMVIVIGSNGARHWHHFCRHLHQWCQWRKPQIVMTHLICLLRTCRVFVVHHGISSTPRLGWRFFCWH